MSAYHPAAPSQANHTAWWKWMVFGVVLLIVLRYGAGWGRTSTTYSFSPYPKPMHAAQGSASASASASGSASASASPSISGEAPSIGTSGLWIHLVLDESGSMSSVQRPTIDAFNHYIQQQHRQSSDSTHVIASLMKFEGGNTNIVYDKQPLDQVPKLDTYNYRPAGGTNLYDAVGLTIQRMDHSLLATSSLFERPAVLVVIFTDGEENSSHLFSGQQIRHMIRDRKEKGWQFIFMGANIEAGDVAESIGISRSSAIKVDSAKAHSNSEALGKITDSYRSRVSHIQAMASSYSSDADGAAQAAPMLSALSAMSIGDDIRSQYEEK